MLGHAAAATELALLFWLSWCSVQNIRPFGGKVMGADTGVHGVCGSTPSPARVREVKHWPFMFLDINHTVNAICIYM